MRAGIPVSYLWNIMASYPANGSNPASDPTFPTLYVCQNLDRDACGASSLPVCTGSSSVSCRVAYSPDDQWNIYTESVAAYCELAGDSQRCGAVCVCGGGLWGSA